MARTRTRRTNEQSAAVARLNMASAMHDAMLARGGRMEAPVWRRAEAVRNLVTILGQDGVNGAVASVAGRPVTELERFVTADRPVTRFRR